MNLLFYKKEDFTNLDFSLIKKGDIKNMPQPKKVQRTVSEHDSGISSMQMSSDATDHQIVVSSLKIKEGKISKANTNAENTKNNNQNKEIPNMEFNPTAKSKNQIANENKKDSSEEGANEGYSYVSGQANLKPKVLFYKHLTHLPGTLG